MGPPPKSHQRRTDRGLSAGPLVVLPARGRRGRAPTWPLDVEPTEQHRKLWVRLWRSPQAVAWQHYEWSRVVARYVLIVLEAEDELDVKLLAEARQLEDRLGLSPLAMLRLRWSVSADEVAEQREAQGQAGARERLRAVE